MKEKHSFIELDETNIIKGIAIVLMFIHHFFTIPSFWTKTTAQLYIDNQFEVFSDCFKICVPVFAFLTGYFYYFTNKKSYRYTIKKITDFWINYLVVFLILILTEVALRIYSFNTLHFVKEVFALSRPTMIFCWYVCFYIGTMLILPIFYRFSEKSDILAIVFFSAIPAVLVFIIKISQVYVLTSLNDFIEYFYFLPVVIVGFECAKFDLLGMLYRVTLFKKRIHYFSLYCLFVLIPFFARGANTYLDIFYAPMFVFGIGSLVKMIKNKRLLLPISLMGKYSLLMWFLHCAFANQLKEITQPILYFPRNPILVTIWGLLMCVTVAFMIHFPIDGLNKIKNKLFRL